MQPARYPIPVLANLKSPDSDGRLKSATTREWMYLFKPPLAGTLLYVKLVLRDDCVIVSFHEDEVSEDEEGA